MARAYRIARPTQMVSQPPHLTPKPRLIITPRVSLDEVLHVPVS